MANATDLETEHEELLQFIYLCPVGILKFDPSGAISLMNPLAMQILGPLSPRMTVENFFDVLEPYFSHVHEVVAAFAPAAGTIVDQMRIFAGSTGRQAVLSLTMTRVNATTYIATFQDITKAVALERQNFLDQQRLRTIFDQVHDYAIYTVDLDGRIIDWNRSIYRLGRWNAEDVVGKSISIFFPPDTVDETKIRQSLMRAVREGSIESEGERVRKDGSTYWGNAVITTLPDPDGRPSGFVVISRDITDRKNREDELVHLATTDPLTGAFNRRYGLERLNEAYRGFKRYGTAVSILMIDADHFKRINDQHGHESGDMVLKHLVACVKGATREVDKTIRWGGEEFLVLMPETTREAAQVAAERISRRICENPIPVVGADISITISAGLVQVIADDSGIESTIKRADVALYAAKAGGRNSIVSA